MYRSSMTLNKSLNKGVFCWGKEDGSSYYVGYVENDMRNEVELMGRPMDPLCVCNGHSVGH